MKRVVLAVVCGVMVASAWAAPKDCEELKAEIEAKIQANSVPSYTLEIVSKKEAAQHDIAMVVGTCENGSKAIIYQRNDD